MQLQRGGINTELKIRDGDYVPNGRGGFVTVSGGEELLQRVLQKLKAPRGAMALMPEFGSTLRKCMRMRPSQREAAVRSAVMEALGDETEAQIESIDLRYENGDALMLDVDMVYNGEKYTATLEVDESENH